MGMQPLEHWGNDGVWLLRVGCKHHCTFHLALYSNSHHMKAGGSTSKVAHAHGWQINADCLQEVSAPPHMDLAMGLLECPHSMAVCKRTWVSDPRECIWLILLSYLTLNFLFSKVHIFSSFITSIKQKLSKSFVSLGKCFSKELSSASSGNVAFCFF